MGTGVLMLLGGEVENRCVRRGPTSYSVIGEAMFRPQSARGTCESRNAGTRNGTRNGSKMRAARYHHAQGVFIHWNGLDLPKNLFSSVGQKLSVLIYSLKLLA